ncbi:MAG: carbohydrate kinase, partial [Paramuribaculum sp.]|nr:carbohydrate kinase [Paramuribaculum sp.]
MKAKYIVGLGEVLWDILPSGRKLGGAPANFAYHVSQFGLPGCVVSAVGRDDLGLEIVEKLDLKNIESTIATVDRPTGTVEVTVDTAGIPSYDIRPDVAWDHIPFTPELEELARNTRAVAFGSLAQRSPESRDTIVKFISAMPDTPDTLIVFDINLRQNHYTKETVEQSLRLCNVLKINDEELETLKQMFGIKVEGP